MTEIRIQDPFLRKIVYTLGIMCIIIAGAYTFALLKTTIALVLDVLTPFLTALLIAYIIAPIVMWLQQRLKLGRIMGAIVLYFLIFLLIFLSLAFLIPTIFSEVARLIELFRNKLPDLLSSLPDYLNLSKESVLYQVILEKMREIDIDYQKIAASIFPVLKQIALGGASAIGETAKGIVSGAGAIIGFFSFLAFVGIIHFYFILDWEKLYPVIQKMVNPGHRQRLFDILSKMDLAMGGFLRGQLTVSLIVGGLFAVGLFFIGFVGFPALKNYCVLIGTICAIGGFIPYLGPVLGVTPAVLIVLMTGDATWETRVTTLLALLGLFTIIQALEGFVLQPRIVGRGAGLHPLVVIFALVVGAQFGIGGMVVAVPLASIVRVLVHELYWLPVLRREESLN